MLIKSADDRTRDLETLTALLSHPAASPSMREKVDLQIRTLRAGARGEAEAAYEIDFDRGASANWAVLHDLRLEHQGRVAQIDHLLINRCLDVWVCESKHFQQGVAINEHGEFTTFYGNRGVGIPSPLEQNRKHLEVLGAILASGLVPLPTRLGMAIRPTLHSVVLVSKGARITRPKKAVPGIDSVVKSDQLRELIDRRAEGVSTLDALKAVARLVASETLEAFARQLAALHRPGSFDWAAKFGVAQSAQRASAMAPPSVPSPVPPSMRTQEGPAVGERASPATPAQAAVPAPVPSHASPPRPVPASAVAPVPAPVPVRPGMPAAPHAASAPPPPRDTAVPASPSGAVPAPAVLREAGRSAAEAEPADGIVRLSTSKLGARLGARNAAEMIDRLTRAGYLAASDAGPVLSDKAKACGAVFVEKSRYGPYFLWPADLRP